MQCSALRSVADDYKGVVARLLLLFFCGRGNNANDCTIPISVEVCSFGVAPLLLLW